MWQTIASEVVVVDRRVGFVVLALVLGCDRAESVAADSIGQVASAAEDKSRELAQDAKKKSDELADDAKKKSGELADDAKGAAEKKLGELGDRAGAYVDAKLKKLMADAKDGTLEANIRDGQSSALDVVRIAKSMRQAVSTDVTVLPIYRPVTDQAKVDEDIGDMPRTEVIDGVTVGFSRVRTLSTAEKKDEDAYLVLWRRGDHIVGFVYEKKSRIDIDKLVAETPKLMKAIGR